MRYPSLCNGPDVGALSESFDWDDREPKELAAVLVDGLGSPAHATRGSAAKLTLISQGINPLGSPGFGAVSVEEATGWPVAWDQRVANDHLSALLNGLRPSILVEIRRSEAWID